ncbi:MAG: glycosyltransferase family 4 protein [Rubrivivax sp.]|nr:glycosyltransferase family 4 protein [Rubrivivax sp.]
MLHRPPPQPTIAYLAPELTALSETFVYQELAALEALGYRVLPYAVHPAAVPAREAQGIASRTTVLYQGSLLRQVVQGVREARRLPRAWPALKTLLQDMRSVGWFDRRAWTLLFQWLAAARMVPALNAAQCTHIHAHFVHVPTQIAMYASALSGIPFTCTAHANDLFRNGLLLAQKAQRARKMLTISHYNKAWLQEQGVAPEQVDVVRCAPDIATRETPRTARHSGAYRIGTLCRLVEKKGVDDLLRALARLVRGGCAPVRLLVAGDGPERLRLQLLADQLGVHAHVDFVGVVAHHAVAQWMRSLDLFVAPCKVDRSGDVDGIPVALMEAMSLGLPVVSTRLSGVPELVVDGKTGLLAEPGDPASLAACIERAMGQPDHARAWGTAARAHVRWEFGREVNLRRLVQHFGDEPAVQAEQPAPEQAAA